MSSTQFNKGPLYGLLAKVKNRLPSKYDPQKEAELCSWIEGPTGLSIGPDFQKGLKEEGIILCTLTNKLQPGSDPKINRSMQNWHQLENLSNFIKAMVSYGMNPVDLFKANDLFESGNITQVQVSLLTLVWKVKTKGLQSRYSENQERNFDNTTVKAGQCIIGLQMGTKKCASQSGMTMYGTRRHPYDPRNHILPLMDHSTISLQMGTNKCRHIYDTKLGTDKCDKSSMSLQMGYTQGANQGGQVFVLGRQLYDPKYCPQGTVADGAEYPLTTRRRPAANHVATCVPMQQSCMICTCTPEPKVQEKNNNNKKQKKRENHWTTFRKIMCKYTCFSFITARLRKRKSNPSTSGD
uniref:Calponin-2 n=1 Tax=Saimiri boliviensis boliviensis TaxID=39432 RepID=A0A2K6UBB1_SAIBB